MASHTQPDVDLEKQSSPDTSSHEREDLQDDPEEEMREHPEGLPEKGTKRSTTFAPMSAPDYKGTQSGDSALGVQRTFSRRQPSLIQHDSHIFGGDLSRAQNELDLERFQSQRGKDVVTVHWEGDDDPECPQNWSKLFRWYLTALAGMLVLNSTFTSSAPSGITPSLQQEFTFSREVATLTISMFVAGYCLGPLVWGPLSERVGRRPVFLVAMFCYTGFNVGCALAPNTASILVFRFLCGAFGASPLTNSGGVIADIWDAKTRGELMSG